MITPQQHDLMLKQWQESGTDREFLAYWGMTASELSAELDAGVKDTKDSVSQG